MIAKIEADSGEVLYIRYDDGRFGGNAVLTFVIGLFLYCEKTAPEGLQWFIELESFTTSPLCTLCQPLLQSLNYNSEWSVFKEDEYEFFQKRYPDFPMSEIEFKRIVEEIEQKYVLTSVLLLTVEKIINVLQEKDLTKSPTYDPLLIADDFQALYKTLSILAERNAHRVRISFI